MMQSMKLGRLLHFISPNTTIRLHDMDTHTYVVGKRGDLLKYLDYTVNEDTMFVDDSPTLIVCLSVCKK